MQNLQNQEMEMRKNRAFSTMIEEEEIEVEDLMEAKEVLEDPHSSIAEVINLQDFISHRSTKLLLSSPLLQFLFLR